MTAKAFLLSVNENKERKKYNTVSEESRLIIYQWTPNTLRKDCRIRSVEWPTEHNKYRPELPSKLDSIQHPL